LGSKWSKFGEDASLPNGWGNFCRKLIKPLLIISSNYIFKGLAFETLGPWCKETIDFINVIGDRLIAESGDSKSKKFLFERISLAIQCGNAASIRGTFPDSALLSEIFAL
jgi:hypothetical protein